MVNHNHKKLKIFTCGLTVATSVVAASVIPVLVYDLSNNVKPINYDNTFEGNKNFVNNFIAKNPNFSFLNAVQVVGNENFGTPGELISTLRYGDITIEQAYEYGLFKLSVPQKLANDAILNGIDIYLKPYDPNTTFKSVIPAEDDSTKPCFYITIAKGEGPNRYEYVYKYVSYTLTGFKKTQEQIYVERVNESIKQNPLNYFRLKKENQNAFAKTLNNNSFYKFGVFDDAADSNSPEIIEQKNIYKALVENGISYEIKNVVYDPFYPSKVKIVYTISCLNSNLNYSFTIKNKEVYINNFPIEQGVDDSTSRVRNFVSSQEGKQFLSNLDQYFIYENNKNNENNNENNNQNNKYDEDIFSAYQNNHIKFKPTDSNLSVASNKGINISFYPYKNAFNIYSVSLNPYNFSIPRYQIVVSAGENTPDYYYETYFIDDNYHKGMFPLPKTTGNKTQAIDIIGTQIDNIEKIRNEKLIDFNNLYQISNVVLSDEAIKKFGFENSNTDFINKNINYSVILKYLENNKKYPFNLTLTKNPNLNVQLPPEIVLPPSISLNLQKNNNLNLATNNDSGLYIKEIIKDQNKILITYNYGSLLKIDNELIGCAFYSQTDITKEFLIETNNANQTIVQDDLVHNNNIITNIKNVILENLNQNAQQKPQFLDFNLNFNATTIEEIVNKFNNSILSNNDVNLLFSNKIIFNPSSYTKHSFKLDPNSQEVSFFYEFENWPTISLKVLTDTLIDLQNPQIRVNIIIEKGSLAQSIDKIIPLSWFL